MLLNRINNSYKSSMASMICSFKTARISHAFIFFLYRINNWIQWYIIDHVGNLSGHSVSSNGTRIRQFVFIKNYKKRSKNWFIESCIEQVHCSFPLYFYVKCQLPVTTWTKPLRLKISCEWYEIQRKKRTLEFHPVIIRLGIILKVFN